MKRIEANKVVKTLNWIMQADEDGQSVLEPKLNDKGIYECEIHLPIIEKTVIGLGDCKLESIDNATQQASNLIDQYLKDCPGTTIKNVFGGSKYVLEEDDDGYLCIHLIQKKEHIMKDEKELIKLNESASNTEEIFINKAIDWNHISRYVNILLDGVREADNPKRMRVEIHLEDEFGKDLSGERIFEMIDEEFERTKAARDLDFCRMWKMNEYVVIVGVKL